MMLKIFTPRFVFVSGLIILAVVSRFIPHLPNFTPLAAIALFGGAYLGSKRLALLVPLLAMLISDVFIGFHSTIWAVYLSFVLITFIGFRMQGKVKPQSVLLTTLASSALFFVVTNFAAWLGSPFYSQDLTGLIACYTAAIPFFNNGIAGDLFYSTVLFGGYYLAGSRFPALVRA